MDWSRDEEATECVLSTDQDTPVKAGSRKDLQSDVETATKFDDQEERQNSSIRNLIHQIFGFSGKEEKHRYSGIAFENLTVKGPGVAIANQPDNGDLLFPGRDLISPKKAAPKKDNAQVLLKDLSGCLRPGEMLLILGQPGSGTNHFLKILANRRAGYSSVEGSVTYGGFDAKTMAAKHGDETIYISEEDYHYPMLTVGTTIRFALSSRLSKKKVVDTNVPWSTTLSMYLHGLLKMLWLEGTVDTKVGGGLIKGISGGEKKRTSIAESLVTGASTQCWDQSTRGLDSSSALQYVQSLRQLTDEAQISTLVTLYQAGESLFKLFDKVLVLHEGRCIFFGPIDKARGYFVNLGFFDPSRWTSADFLVSVTDPRTRQIREGCEGHIPRTAEDFTKAFQSSEDWKNAQLDLQQWKSIKSGIHLAPTKSQISTSAKSRFELPFITQVYICTIRHFEVLWGDTYSFWGKWFGIIGLALVVGSLFYNLPLTSTGVFSRGGVLFFIVLLNSLFALSEVTSLFAGQQIMFKHREFSFYRPSAFALALVIVDVFQIAVQVTLLNVVIYFMSNLQRDASHFFIALFVAYISALAMFGLFRAIGSLAGSLDIATPMTGVVLQGTLLYTGYLIPPISQHPWLYWIRYLNPIAYAFEALMANEFTGLQLQCVPPQLVPLGPQVSTQSCLIPGSALDATIVDGTSYIESSFNYTRTHLWRNCGIIIALWLIYSILTMVGTELQRSPASLGTVNYFKRGTIPAAAKKSFAKNGLVDDEESQPDNSIQALEKNEKKITSANVGFASVTSVFTFQDVGYIVPTKGGEKKLLSDVNGYVKPGRITALMGASGAGKTTLLNVLSQRTAVGKVAGSMMINGHSLPGSFQRTTGFVEQMDVHEPTATVREALEFSALLRRPQSVPVERKYELVEEVIELLELTEIAEVVIGTPGAGLDPNQRKRVTIGVELCSKPESLIFLDEPTSGLDSNAAVNILRCLRTLADTGLSILCTIHQPSATLFECFDDLLLLQSGGRTVYHGPLGPNCETLTGYFESHGAFSCPRNANAAEYMLQAIGAGDPDYQGQNWSDTWLQSRECDKRIQEIHGFIKMESGILQRNSDEKSEFAMPLYAQIIAITKRCFVAYWRTPDYTIGKFALHIISGLFNAFTFWKMGNTTIDLQNRVFSVFLSLTIAPPLIQQLQPRFLHFRDIFASREYKSKIYSSTAFSFAVVLVELPYSAVAGTLFWCCWYWGVGFPKGTFPAAFSWMLMLIFEIYYVGLGQMIASFSPNEFFASLLVPVFFSFIISFCGVVVPYPALTHFWQSWMYPLTPFRYLLEAWIGTILHEVPVQCSESEFARFTPPQGVSCQQYVQQTIQTLGGYVEDINGICNFCQYANGDEYSSSLNLFYSSRWRDYGIMWAYCVFHILVVFAATYIYLSGTQKIRKRFTSRSRGGS